MCYFRAGEIEAWGRGIERIVTACKEYGAEPPEWSFDGTGIWVVFRIPKETVGEQDSAKNVQDHDKMSKTETENVQDGNLVIKQLPSSDQDCGQVGEQVGEQVQRIIDCIKDDELTMDEILRKLKIASRRFVLMKILIPAIEGGYVNRKYPDTPRSPKQKYYLTEKGKQMINNINNK